MSHDNTAGADRLQEIQAAISELVGEARDILRHTSHYRRADAYWLSQLEAALGERHGEMCTMTETIEEMRVVECAECGAERDASFCPGCEAADDARRQAVTDQRLAEVVVRTLRRI